MSLQLFLHLFLKLDSLLFGLNLRDEVRFGAIAVVELLHEIVLFLFLHWFKELGKVDLIFSPFGVIRITLPRLLFGLSQCGLHVRQLAQILQLLLDLHRKIPSRAIPVL
uniref:(northern house mosquito) hypothetical protein n=1 Tax=Culex pipiens TaxID=7175 RepID=A0A8D8HCR2_CULPI